MDQTALIDFQVSNATQANKTPVAVLSCPANERGAAAVVCTSSAESSYGSSSASMTNGRCDYAGNGGNTTTTTSGGVTFRRYEGPFYSGNTLGCKFAQVTDGTSNTIGFGEVSLYNCHTTSSDAVCYLGWSAKPAVKGSNRSPTPGLTAGISTGNWNSNFGFSTPHVNRIHFAFLDGSVRSLRLFGHQTSFGSAEYLSFQRLCGKADEEATDNLLD
jgi:prepilin-type processing-associated H-X9-DG protein